MQARRNILKTTIALALFGNMALAAAQGAYPDKPIRIVVPSSPGSFLDMLARQVGERMFQQLGQSVVVENKTGASGILAYDMVAKSKPDGYTIGMVQAGFVSNKFLYKNVHYDEFKDFAPIALIARSPMILVTRNDYPSSSLSELKQAGKASPGKLTYASVNGANYMNTELMRKQLDLDLRHIPYKETSQALTDVLAGHVDVYLASYSAALPMIRGGKMKAFATLSKGRIAEFPNVPSANELGMSGDIQTWAGLLAPAGTPPAVVAKLHDVVNRIVAEPAVRAKLVESGYEPFIQSSSDFTDLMRREIDTYARVAKETGVTPE
ncbi:tripartite tricarboxylate transporter substrate binding protein [soil metagenome]